MQEREYRIAPEDESPDRPAAWKQWERAGRRPWWRRNREWLILVAAAAAIAAIVLAATANRPAHTAATSTTTASPAQMLADLDGDTTPLGQYEAALNALEPKCTQDQAGIAALANAGYQDLVKNGVTDETRLSVMQHLAGSVPAGTVRVDCASVLSAYLVLREG